MGKGMTMAGMVVAVLIFVLFALDLLTGLPFKRGQSADGCDPGVVCPRPGLSELVHSAEILTDDHLPFVSRAMPGLSA